MRTLVTAVGKAKKSVPPNRLLTGIAYQQQPKAADASMLEPHRRTCLAIEYNIFYIHHGPYQI